MGGGTKNDGVCYLCDLFSYNHKCMCFIIESLGDDEDGSKSEFNICAQYIALMFWPI